MANKYKVLVYSETYDSKEEATQNIGKIKNHILDGQEELTVRQLAKKIQEGHPVAFCHAERIKGDRKRSFRNVNWRYQQILAVDIDNADKDGLKASGEDYLSMKQAKERCCELAVPPAFMYHTLSSTPTWERYRIVWVLDEPIYDPYILSRAMRALFSVLVTVKEDGEEAHHADEKCADLSRVFFGGKDIKYLNPKAITETTALLTLGKELEEVLSLPTEEELKAEENRSYDETEEENDSSEGAELSMWSHTCLDNIIREVHAVAQHRKIRPISSETLVAQGLQAFGANGHKESLLRNLGRLLDTPQTLMGQGFVNDQYRILHSIPIDEFLLGDSYSRLQCILPNHRDRRPSASIYCNDKGVYRYHCFACDVDCDIFELLERLSGESHFVVRKYLCEKFELPLETDWQREKRAELTDLDDYLHQSDFQDNYPELYDTLIKKHLIGTYHMMIETGRRLLLDRNATGVECPVFFLPIGELEQLYRSFGFHSSLKTIWKNVNQLARYSLVRILSDDDLPSAFIDRLDKWRVKRQYRYRPTIYSIPMLTPDIARKAIRQIRFEKKNNVRRTNLNRSQIVMADEDTANRTFVQQVGEDIPDTVKWFYKRYKASAERLISRKGYTCEKEICSHIRGLTQKQKESLSITCMPRLLQDLGLQKVPFTKEIEEQYHVISTQTYKYFYGASRIIIPKGENKDSE